MTIALIIVATALVVGLVVILVRRSSGSELPPRDVEHLRPSAEGGHQGRSPGADGGGMSYYNGG
ncbi:hypothetical protein [Aeromicrobium sp. 9AM]|uniref:hypothetical protein n=1 Tax=Aeromicrobium sp. 9AM TaxID=2653126 RepID=UPI0012EFE48C|nr:hypothetical protein [Aeromicrobium sp. 9AM]VXA98475.1 conserved hypothetical protein [Aeromicrobium sp. 9AM]